MNAFLFELDIHGCAQSSQKGLILIINLNEFIFRVNRIVRCLVSLLLYYDLVLGYFKDTSFPCSLCKYCLECGKRVWIGRRNTRRNILYTDLHYGAGVWPITCKCRRSTSSARQVRITCIVIIAYIDCRERCWSIVIENDCLSGKLREIHDHVCPFCRSQYESAFIHNSHIEVCFFHVPVHWLVGQHYWLRQKSAFCSDLDKRWACCIWIRYTAFPSICWPARRVACVWNRRNHLYFRVDSTVL